MSDLILAAKLSMRIVRNKSYPGLSEELKPFYCYLTDGGGHSLIIVPTMAVIPPDPDSPYDEMSRPLMPAPIKTVLRHGYKICNGYLYCDVPYARLTGVHILPEDLEF
jgi:hypothetical protein